MKFIDPARDRSERGGSFQDRKSTRLNSSHLGISYAVFCLKKKNTPPRSLHFGSPHGVWSEEAAARFALYSNLHPSLLGRSRVHGQFLRVHTASISATSTAD